MSARVEGEGKTLFGAGMKHGVGVGEKAQGNCTDKQSTTRTTEEPTTYTTTGLWWTPGQTAAGVSHR